MKKNKRNNPDSLLSTLKKLTEKLPSVSFRKADSQSSTGKEKVKGVWFTWKW